MSRRKKPDPKKTAQVLFGAVSDSIEGDVPFHAAVFGQLRYLIELELEKINRYLLLKEDNQ